MCRRLSRLLWSIHVAGFPGAVSLSRAESCASRVYFEASEARLNVVRPPFSQILNRAVDLRCPYCGRGKLFRGVFRMFLRCPECGLSYFPEQGYYLGAMIINYAVVTAVVITLFLLSLLLPNFTRLTTNEKITLWIIFAIALSLTVMRHSYSFWLGVDFWIKPRRPDEP
jgi:uncharacterized protein (DUF983 family)